MCNCVITNLAVPSISANDDLKVESIASTTNSEFMTTSIESKKSGILHFSAVTELCKIPN